MFRVGLIGCPGAGKTTTAWNLAGRTREALGVKKVELVQEYARRYIIEYGHPTTIQEQFRMLKKQQSWEDRIAPETEIMVTDSPLFLGFSYALGFPRGRRDEVRDLCDLFKEMQRLNCPPRYDVVLWLSPRDVLDDGVRSRKHMDPKWQERMESDLGTTLRLFPPKNPNRIYRLDPGTDSNLVEQALIYVELAWKEHAL